MDFCVQYKTKNSFRGEKDKSLFNDILRFLSIGGNANASLDIKYLTGLYSNNIKRPVTRQETKECVGDSLSLTVHKHLTVT